METMLIGMGGRCCGKTNIGLRIVEEMLRKEKAGDHKFNDVMYRQVYYPMKIKLNAESPMRSMMVVS